MSYGGTNSRTTPRTCRVALGLICIVWQPLVSPAQSQVTQPVDSPDALSEVVVTATRQPQTIDKVPISIAAYTEKTLADLNVQSIDDLSRITPGITFTRNSFGNGDQSMIAIRGISSSVGASTTGVYIDDTPVQIRNVGFTATNAYPSMFDLNRVEVLRGPQGTLFGAGAEGGAVRFITPSPSLTDYSMYGRAELAAIQDGGQNSEAGLAVGGPIIDDTLGFRLSGYYRQDGGYIDRINYFSGNVDQPNSNYKNTFVVHGSLLWAPIENLSITPSLYFQNSFLNDANAYWEDFSSNGRYENAALGPQPSTDQFYLPSVKIEWGGASVHVVSNTSYFTRDNHGVNEYTTSENVNLGCAITPRCSDSLLPGETQAGGHYANLQTAYTQEFRFLSPNPDGRFNWVAGAFYQHASTTNNVIVRDPNTNIIATYGFGVPTTGVSLLGPLLPGNGIFQNSETDTDQQVAGFGQVDYGLTSKLKLSAGARVSRTQYDYTATSSGVFGPSGSSGHELQTPVTPHYGVSYQADPHALYYFSASEGFRPGGGNQPVPIPFCAASLALFGLTNTPSSYASDSVWSYELGAKNQFLGGRLQTEVSAYHIIWQNIQTAVNLACGSTVNLNLGRAVSNGFDLAGRYRMTDALTVGWSAGYDDAYYTKTVQTGVQPSGAPALAIRQGDPLGQTPWTVTAMADYRFIALRQNAFLHLDYQYSSHDHTPLDPDVASYDPDIPRTPAVSNLNVRLGINIRQVEWALFATNLTNDLPEIARFHPALGDPLYTGITVRPRTVGLQARFRY
jgi:iron complex outermembrane recepter protein